MHKEVEALIEDLAQLCQTVLLGDQEWQRLYEIALCLHAHGGLSETRTVKRFLLDHGCSLQKAGFLSRQILHLCRVLGMYDEQKRKASRTSG